MAYRDEAFLESQEGRPLRILSEYVWPYAHFQDEKIQDTIVFFGSARIMETGALSNYYRRGSRTGAAGDDVERQPAGTDAPLC